MHVGTTFREISKNMEDHYKKFRKTYKKAQKKYAGRTFGNILGKIQNNS